MHSDGEEYKKSGDEITVVYDSCIDSNTPERNESEHNVKKIHLQQMKNVRVP